MLKPIFLCTFLAALTWNANVEAQVILSDNFDRGSLGASYTQVALNQNGNQPTAPYFSIVSNQLESTNTPFYVGDNGYVAFNNSFSLFSGANATDPLEVVQADVMGSDAGLALDMGGHTVSNGTLNNVSGYMLRFNIASGNMLIQKVVSGVLINTVASQTISGFSSSVLYDLEGITDNKGDLTFQVWSTDANGNPVSLLTSLSGTDTNLGGRSPITGGFAGVYSLQSVNTYDNFSISAVPEPGTVSLISASAVMLFGALRRRKSSLSL